MAPGQTRDQTGRLVLGDVAADRLAEIYDTPLLVLDLNVVDAVIRSLVRCAANECRLEIAYAAKAFATVEFIRHLTRHEIGLDVCSLGELVTAEHAGFPAERLTLHGAGKSDAELLAACSGRLGFLAVDGIEELSRLARLAKDGCSAQLLLRLNVGIEARTHAFVRTGGDDTKFGIHPRDEVAAIALLKANPQLRFVGVHAHIGSQIYEVEPFVANAAALVAAAVRFAEAGFLTQRLVIGGGFGVQTQPNAGDELLDLEATVGAVSGCVASQMRERRLALPALGIEPGRSIVASAGTTLYRVLAVKRQTHRTFVVVDGGIAENPRPALYGARHHVLPVAPAGDSEEVTLCGRSCENDELGVVRLPRDVRAGDLLAMCVTGAYTYSMAGNYNRFPRAAVVAVSSGVHRLLARRESLDQVLANDVNDGVDASGLLPRAF